MMLTAKDDELEKIIGLELGADDYMTKPFSPREVLARMKAIMRRMSSKSKAEEALKDIIYPDAPKMVTPQIIIQVVADHFGIKAEDITSKKRTAEIVVPRQVVMYLCRELTDISLKNIAKVLDKKDHSTIINGIQKIQDEINNDSDFANQINIIRKKINPS